MRIFLQIMTDKLRELVEKAKGNSVESYKNQFMLLDYLRKHADDFIRLLEAAESVIERWDTPAWKDVPATVHYIGDLRKALAPFKEKS